MYSVGDFVRITNLHPKHQNPDKLPWITDYDPCLGEVGKVVYKNNYLILVEFQGGSLRSFYPSELSPAEGPATDPWWAADYNNLII